MQIASINFNGKNAKRIRDMAPYCAYTGEKFSDNNPASIEHLVPESKGGTKSLPNILIVGRDINNHRQDKDIKELLENHPEYVKNIQCYLDDMRDIVLSGIPYSNAAKNTLNKLTRNKYNFRGRNIDILG